MKLRLIKITPTGHDPEFMVVTYGSTAHTMVKDYAKDNAYPIEDNPVIWSTILGHGGGDVVEVDVDPPRLPTYEEYTKGWSLADKMSMYYDEDINPTKWTCADIARIIEMGKNWLPDFELRFKEYLIEREYING